MQKVFDEMRSREKEGKFGELEREGWWAFRVGEWKEKGDLIRASSVVGWGAVKPK